MRFYLTMLLTVAGLFPSAFGEVVTDMRVFKRFTDDDYRPNRPFAVTGRVSAVTARWFALTDGETACLFDVYNVVSTPPTPLAVGELVSVEGVTELYNGIDQALSARTIRRLDAPVVAPPPPLDAPPRQILSGVLAARNVKVTGVITAVEPDEFAADCQWLIIATPDASLCATSPGGGKFNPADLVDATVSVVGTVMPSRGKRRFLRSYLAIVEPGGLAVLTPPPKDPFSDSPPLEKIETRFPEFPSGLNRRRIDGLVTAAWRGDRFFLKTDGGTSILVRTNGSQPLPHVGERIRAVAFVETDVFFPRLFGAIFKRLPGAPTPPEAALAIRPEDMFVGPNEKRNFAIDKHGRPVALRGVVRGIAESRLDLDCDGRLVAVDTSSLDPDALPEKGATVEVAGICLVELERDGQYASFPRTAGFSIITRTPDDITILVRPPWWTPRRLLTVILALFAGLVAILVWNRILNRLVERRGRALMREGMALAAAELKIDERTRLAVELHDTIAQNLTGVSLQLDAASSAAANEPAAVEDALRTASLTLQNCRNDLRNCLWDLRSRAFEEKKLDAALRRTVAPHLAGATADITSDLACAQLSDNVLHAVLSIVRELTVNAVRHGHAHHISVTADADGDGVVIRVTDDGCGFDPATRPGVADGHFGLQGIAERIRRLDGTLDIESAVGRGATFTIRLP